MKVEAWFFAACTVFFALVTPAYWLVTDASSHGADWTGTSVLTMTTLLALMVTLYLGLHARRMEPRPEDRKDAEIADGAGELGFFPPYSWWPMWCALAMGMCVVALAIPAWWMLFIGGALLAMAVLGWVFEYYRGEHAH